MTRRTDTPERIITKLSEVEVTLTWPPVRGPSL